MGKTIDAYKGFNADMTCLGKQYQEGETYTEDEAKVCEYGMHACKNPLDLFRYYRISKDAKYHKVECSGDISRKDDDSKFACTKIKIGAEIKFADIVKIGISMIWKRINKNKKISTSSDCSTGAASGDCSTGAASGKYSTGAASGEYSIGAAWGDCSTGAASGECSTGVASGYCSTGSASGFYSTGAASGSYSTGAASGESSTGAASGNFSTGAASGDYSTGAASGLYSTGAASGESSTGVAFGDWSIGAASGDYSTGAASGKDSIAVANGYEARVKGAIGCYLVTTEYSDDMELLHCKMAYVDGEKIKADTLYMLKNGEFVEVN